MAFKTLNELHLNLGRVDTVEQVNSIELDNL